MKKLVFALLAVMLVLGCVVAFAAEDECQCGDKQWDAGFFKNGAAFDCKVGSGYDYHKCGNCTKLFKVYTYLDLNNSVNHKSVVEDVHTPSNCGKTGLKDMTCTHCGREWKNLTVAITGTHVYDEASVKCNAWTGDGQNGAYLKCTVCKTDASLKFIKAPAHVYDEASVKCSDKDACSVPGKDLKCSVCKEDYTLKHIAAPAHVYAPFTKEVGTCVDLSWEYEVCTCGAVKPGSVKHELDPDNHVALQGPLTGKDGKEYYVCNACETIIEPEDITVKPEDPTEEPEDPTEEPEEPTEKPTEKPEEPTEKPTEKPDAPVVTPDNGNTGSKPSTTPSGVVIPATGDNTSNAAFVVLAAAIVGLAVLAISKKARA